MDRTGGLALLLLIEDRFWPIFGPHFGPETANLGRFELSSERWGFGPQTLQVCRSYVAVPTTQVCFFGFGKTSTPIGRGAVDRAQQKNLEDHSAVCVPQVPNPAG